LSLEPGEKCKLTTGQPHTRPHRDRRWIAPDLRNPWHDGYVPDKPTSEQIRREAEKLREPATKLIEQAKILIEKSAELEKQVSYRNRDTSKRSKKQ
jgi:hypothetical protein